MHENSGPSPGFRSRGITFLKYCTIFDVCSDRGPNMKWAGRTPLATALWKQRFWWRTINYETLVSCTANEFSIHVWATTADLPTYCRGVLVCRQTMNCDGFLIATWYKSVVLVYHFTNKPAAKVSKPNCRGFPEGRPRPLIGKQTYWENKT